MWEKLHVEVLNPFKTVFYGKVGEITGGKEEISWNAPCYHLGKSFTFPLISAEYQYMEYGNMTPVENFRELFTTMSAYHCKCNICCLKVKNLDKVSKKKRQCTVHEYHISSCWGLKVNPVCQKMLILHSPDIAVDKVYG